MATTLDEFIESIAQSGLMDAEEVRAFLAALPQDRQPQTAEDLAREMYHLGKLTKFQANAVYQKKTRGLVAGNYVVLDRLGKGGMGTVYKAQHRRMKRIVALKMLPSSATKSPEAVKRFQREVEAAAKLSHPNIVTAYDADEAKGVHFLVMEYVEGQDLHALVKQQGPVSVAQAVDYLVQAARGLQYAHGQGIIHRDIKPPNLLVDKNGTIKILDMGLARIDETVGSANAAAEESLTQSGQVMGTLDFMPPEQALDMKSVDLRADIYSLGCTLFYLLTGRPPFGGDTIGKKIVAHREAPIPSLRVFRDDVPESLDAAFQKMLAKRPEHRPASMTEVISQLQGCAVQGAGARPWLPPSASSHAETMDVPPGGQAETSRSESLLVEELFASDPVELPERLVAPSSAAGSRWTNQQKMAMVATGGVMFMLLLGTVLKSLTKETSQATLEPQAEVVSNRASEPLPTATTTEPPSPAPEKSRQQTQDTPAASDGFVSLFDGRTLNGWEGDTSRYSVEDGKLVVDFGSQPLRGPGGDLFTAKEYQDFILRLEYTMSAAANGGILLRAPLVANNWRESLEVQLLDDSAPLYQKLPLWNHNAALFGVVAVKPGHLKPPGQWNTLEIQWKGRRITETLNGVVVLDTDLDDPADKSPRGAGHPGLKREKGRIILLGYASQGRLQFRNVQIKDIRLKPLP